MTTRRQFFRRAALSGVGFSTFPTSGFSLAAENPPVPKPVPKAESLVKELFSSLDEVQRKELVYPFDNPLRRKISNNWHITKQRIDTFLNADQNRLVREIFLAAHSEEYAETVIRQVEHDSGKKGFGDSSIAIFGDPSNGDFQFVLTGRHCTRRVGGEAASGKAFGGPIFYGHAAESFDEGPEHRGNAYWYQAQSANRLFTMLDGKQREKALQDKRTPDDSSTIKLRRTRGDLLGLALSEMSPDQKAGLQKILDDLLMPFRESDRVKAMEFVKKGGMDDLHLVFYREADIGDDKVWDNWRIEGPHMAWYFRGSPHVHAWAHISDPDAPVVADDVI